MALSALIEWDIRTAGSDSSGGGFKAGASGTDYSQFDAAQFSGTDLAVDGAVNTKVTSATHNFVAADVGNVIQITAGAGFTTGFYEIASVSANAATLDRSPAATGTTGGTWAEGGALLTLAKANGTYVAGNKIHIKAGTYTLTASVVVVTTGTATAPVAWIGYNAAHEDAGTKPLITTATNSTPLFTVNNVGWMEWRNLKFTNTAGTKAQAIQGVTASATSGYWKFVDDNFDGLSTAIDGSSRCPPGMYVIRTLLQNNTSYGVADAAATNIHVIDSVFYNNTLDGYYIASHSTVGAAGSGGVQFDRSIFAKNRNGIYDDGTVRAISLTVTNCTFVDNTAAGIRSDETTTAVLLTLKASIFYNNTTYGVNFAFASSGTDFSVSTNDYNAYGANGTAARTGLSAGVHDVPLTADPFTDKANKDWTLNTTAGGGDSARSAAFPGQLQVGGTGYLDIGALQHLAIILAVVLQMAAHAVFPDLVLPPDHYVGY